MSIGNWLRVRFNNVYQTNYIVWWLWNKLWPESRKISKTICKTFWRKKPFDLTLNRLKKLKMLLILL